MTEEKKIDEIKITTRQKIAFGIGGFGKNAAYGIVSTYTLYFYNSVLGVSAAFIGTLLMAARIFDAFNDPFMGIIVARTKSRWGRYKPWIFSGAILNALVLAAMFTVPENLQGGGLKAYVSITYVLCGITYTLSDIPFWSVIPAITRPGKTREDFTSFARLLTGLGTGFAAALSMALIELFGGGNTIPQLKKGFTIVAILYGVLYIVTTIINVRNLPNEELDTPVKAPSVRELFGMLFKNDQALSVALVVLFFTAATYLTTNLLIYIFEYDLGKKNLYTPFSVLVAAGQVAGMLLYPFLRKKHLKNRKICIMACIASLLSYAVFTVASFFGTFALPLLIIFGTLIAVSNGTFYVMITLFIAGAVDYGEEQTGTRENSMISSLQTLINKLAGAFAVFFAGIGIDLAGIVQDAAVQSEKSTLILRLLFSVPSLVLMLLAFILFLKKKSLAKE